MRWDVFCRVVDNHGDVGVCWRLACDLASRGETVRLWLDDDAALQWMAPSGARGVEVLPWRGGATESGIDAAPHDVVVEAFGCDPPESFVARMAHLTPAPVWINLEYLSAEPYVERSHGLPSPQFGGPGRSLIKWFFYPGFTTATGGLLRETELMSSRAAFDRKAWLRERGIAVSANERLVSVFSYAKAPLHALAQALSDQETLLLLAPGAAQGLLAPGLLHGPLRAIAMPWLEQADYDRLLWSCDINFVRGEDSFVRAMWAGAPFVWNIYAQRDGAHLTKLEAFMSQFGAARVPGLANLWRCWNGASDALLPLPDIAAWRDASLTWRDQLLAQRDLVTQLLDFVGSKQAS